MIDLFGMEEEPRVENAELFAGLCPSLRSELARLHELWIRAEQEYRRRGGGHRRVKAASRKRAYLQLRDHLGTMSHEEIQAERIAAGGGEPLPLDNRELFR